VVSPPSLNAPSHAATIRRLNASFFLAARDAARESVPFAMAAFGVSRHLAEWLVSAGADEVMALARLSVCAFAVRLPATAVARACQPGRPGTADPDGMVFALHTALLAAGDYA
jgi:hypothetical protein